MCVINALSKNIFRLLLCVDTLLLSKVGLLSIYCGLFSFAAAAVTRTRKEC